MTRNLLLLSLLTLSTLTFAEESSVTLHLDTAHEVGGISTFDREKFITIHSAHTESDWDGEKEKLNYLVDDLDVYFGRETGAITWELTQLREDSTNRGFVDFKTMQQRAREARETYALRTHLHRYENRSDLVICAQVNPFWPGSDLIRPPDGSPHWALANPTATAQYMVYWLNMFTGGNGVPRPKYLEIMNEPLYELAVSHPEVKPREAFDYHKQVAEQIRALNDEVLLGGYTAAFPDFEKDDFKRWETRWKDFIDVTGDDIDFYSLHLYDFPGIDGGKKRYRKGANLEATFDMLEHYSVLKSGKVKPFLISEYGSQLNDWYDQPWSPYRDWLCLKAINSMLMQFSAKPDRIIKAIPFIAAKAEWGHNMGGSGEPYYWRLMRRANEPEAETGDWVFTDQIKFYELWSGVRGERRLIRANDPDLLVNAYVEGNRASLIFNNLGTDPKKIELETAGAEKPARKKLLVKHLYPFENKARLDWVEKPPETSAFELGSEATMIVEITFSEAVPAESKVIESKHYATSYFQKIEAEAPLKFILEQLPEMNEGEAILRLGVGRDHGQSLRPLVHVNGQLIPVPESYKGPDQKDKLRFFGVLEIPVPIEHLQDTNEVMVQFPDVGGHVSSLALEIIRFDPS